MATRTRRAFVAEPPARYITRAPAVVDCSMVCAVLFDEPERDDAERLLAGRRLLAPVLLNHEVVNVALKKRRRGLPGAAVQRALLDYADQDIELLPVEVLPSFALAQRYDLSAYDAAYLWVAETVRAPLLTFDSRLGAAAQRHLQGLD